MESGDCKALEKEKYSRYLSTISFNLFLTAIIGIVIVCVNYATKVFLNKTAMVFAIVALALMLFGALWGVLLFSEPDVLPHLKDFLENKRKDRWVTFLFFVHLLLVVIFVLMDGGAQNSAMSNVILLDAGFGFYFASKRYIKSCVLIFCFLGYWGTSVLHYVGGECCLQFAEGYKRTGEFIARTFILLIVFSFVLIANYAQDYQKKKSETGNSEE